MKKTLTAADLATRLEARDAPPKPSRARFPRLTRFLFCASLAGAAAIPRDAFAADSITEAIGTTVDAANMGYNSGVVAGARGDDPPTANTGNTAWDNAFNSAVATGFAVGESYVSTGLNTTAGQVFGLGAGYYDAYYSTLNGNPASPNAPLSTSPEWGAYWAGWELGYYDAITSTQPATLEVQPDTREATLEMPFDTPQEAFAAGFAFGQDLEAFGVTDLEGVVDAETGNAANDAAFSDGMAEGDGTGCNACNSCSSCSSCSSCGSCSSCS